jgi:hypothetical protein
VRSSPAQCLPFGLAQHPDEHRPERPVLLAVDQQLGEGAALWLAPELADSVGPVEVRQHQDVEQLGANARWESFEATPGADLTRGHWRRVSVHAGPPLPQTR